MAPLGQIGDNASDAEIGQEAVQSSRTEETAMSSPGRLKLGYFAVVGILATALIITTLRLCSAPAFRAAGTSGKHAKFIGPASVGDSALDESGSTGIVGSKSLNVTSVPLTDASLITTDASLSNIFTVTLGGNRTLANPTNLVTGGVYAWVISQDGSGSRTLAYASTFTWSGGIVPTLSTTPSAVDVISAIYDGSKLRASIGKAYQ
jgi:hypothetical protein